MAAWVVLGGAPGETAHCTRCGAGLSLQTPIAIPDYLAAAGKFERDHKRCGKQTYQPLTPRIPEEWIRTRDVGVSSATIWAVLTGTPSPFGRYDVPHDAADFGRCHRLLQLFPLWRVRLEKVADAFPEWTPFVRGWSRLEALYAAAEREETSNAGELTQEIRRLEAENRRSA